MGQRVTLENVNTYSGYYDVKVAPDDKDYSVIAGYLFKMYDSYYYASVEDAGDFTKGFSPYDLVGKEVWEITDESAAEMISSAEQKYYSDGLGFLSDDTLTDDISTAFLILAFGVFPLLCLSVFLVLSLRSHGTYRKVFASVCVISALSLVTFTSVLISILSIR
jgi:hypothetical protein